MEFLKAILGDELYAQLAEKLNAHNGDEANKDRFVLAFPCHLAYEIA